MSIIRKVRNDKSQSIFLNTGNVELPPSTTVDLYSYLTDDRLLEAQTELGILQSNGSITVIETDADEDVRAGGTENITGTIVATNDNATSFRLRGPNHASEGGTNVQSYAGIFYNDGYDGIGTLKTRASFGANVEMDLALQSPHALMLLATDGTQTDGKIVAASTTNVEFHLRADAETESPVQLTIDRVDTGTTGISNTSDIVLNVTSGNINFTSSDGGIVVPIRALNPTTLVTGLVWYDSVTNQFKGYNGTNIIILG